MGQALAGELFITLLGSWQADAGAGEGQPEPGQEPDPGQLPGPGAMPPVLVAVVPPTGEMALATPMPQEGEGAGAPAIDNPKLDPSPATASLHQQPGLTAGDDPTNGQASPPPTGETRPGASPAANRNWAAQATAQLTAIGIGLNSSMQQGK